jgi:hypothetical protein
MPQLSLPPVVLQFVLAAPFADESLDFIQTLMSVLLGFGFAATWDVWKLRRQQVSDAKAASKNVRTEFAANVHSLQENVKMTTADSAAAREDKEVVAPLQRLSVAALESAIVRASIEPFSSALHLALMRAYQNAFVINNRIEFRELYRATNAAMSNFANRREMINDALTGMMTDHVKELQTLDGDISRASAAWTASPSWWPFKSQR